LKDSMNPLTDIDITVIDSCYNPKNEPPSHTIVWPLT
jgi:hypothetical protein